MIYGGGLLGLALLILWIYCIVDVISTDGSVIRNLPKVLWLVIVILIPTIGSILWLLLGRPERASLAPGGSGYRAEPSGRAIDRTTPRSYGVLAPDDDPHFLAELDERTKRLRDWEDDLKRREDELRQQREEGDEPPAV